MSVTKRFFFDELCEDDILIDAELHFKTSIVYANLDISKLSARFEGLQTVTKRFRCDAFTQLLRHQIRTFAI